MTHRIPTLASILGLWACLLLAAAPPASAKEYKHRLFTVDVPPGWSVVAGKTTLNLANAARTSFVYMFRVDNPKGLSVEALAESYRSEDAFNSALEKTENDYYMFTCHSFGDSCRTYFISIGQWVNGLIMVGDDPMLNDIVNSVTMVGVP